MLILILLKCFINNKYVYLLLIKFFYRQICYLGKYQRRVFFLYYLKKARIRFFFLKLNFLLVNFKLYARFIYFFYMIYQNK